MGTRGLHGPWFLCWESCGKVIPGWSCRNTSQIQLEAPSSCRVPCILNWEISSALPAKKEMQTVNLSLSWGRHIEESVWGDAGTQQRASCGGPNAPSGWIFSLNRTRETQELHARRCVQSPLPEES